jgi:hypothetical protein
VTRTVQDDDRCRLAVSIGAPGGDADVHLWSTSFLSDLASRGTWARLTSSYHSQTSGAYDETVEDRWRALSSGFRVGAESPIAQGAGQTRSLWQLLSDAGKQVVASSYPLGWPLDLLPQATTRASEIDGRAPAETIGWDVSVSVHETADTATDPNTGLPGAEASADLWARWDQYLSSEFAGSALGRMNMIVALPTNRNAEGLLVLEGNGIAALGDLGTLDLLDIAPTVLSLFQVPVPSWMEGEVVDVLEQDDYPLSDEEQELLQKHLSGLGYFG